MKATGRKTILVTGASAGIGRAAALRLAREGGHLVLACREETRGEKALSEIPAATGSRDVELRLVDLSSQASIRAFAQEFQKSYSRLDVLVNNAGTWLTKRQVGEEGIELTWAINMLGYSLLTELLLPLLKASAPSRIVSVASNLARDLDLDDVEFQKRPYDGTSAYAQSKQANRMWTWALSRRLSGSGVTANALHPGTVKTELLRHAFGSTISGKTPEEGADTVCYLATSPEVEGLSGRYFVDRTERECRFASDEAGQEKLYELCKRMTYRPA